MIKIKNYIFNGNEIEFMKINENEIEVCPKAINVKIKVIKNVTLNDIEWNYQDKETNYLKYREKELKYYNEILENQYQDKLKKIKELEEENEKLKETIKELSLQNKTTIKGYDYLKPPYEVTCKGSE